MTRSPAVISPPATISPVSRRLPPILSSTPLNTVLVRGGHHSSEEADTSAEEEGLNGQDTTQRGVPGGGESQFYGCAPNGGDWHRE